MLLLLINLDRAPERLEHTRGVFDAHKLGFQRVPAVDGLTLPAGEVARLAPSTGIFYQLGAGEVGCFLSHRACWQIIADGPDAYVAIFEDDIHLGVSAFAILSDPSWIPADADIIKLETNTTLTAVDRIPAGAIGARKISRLRGEHSGSAGYIISRKAAARLLAHSRMFHDPVDQFMFNPAGAGFGLLVTYQMHPALCIQDQALNGKATRLRSALREERPTFEPRPTSTLGLVWRELKRPFKRARVAWGLSASPISDNAAPRRIPFS